MIRSIIISLAATIAVGALAQPAAAQDRRGSAAVQYEDLDLSRERGAEILLRRLENAAQRVCGNAHHRRISLADRAAFGRCVDATLDAAVASVDEPLVSQRYAGGRIIVVASN
jgi:UrcA family protein